MQTATSSFDPPLVGAAIVLLSVLALALFLLVSAAERLLLPWAHERPQQPASGQG
jgi:ABC-type nitrate/sulfonate/bicarbonate transport system permease component